MLSGCMIFVVALFSDRFFPAANGCACCTCIPCQAGTHHNCSFCACVVPAEHAFQVYDPVSQQSITEKVTNIATPLSDAYAITKKQTNSATPLSDAYAPIEQQTNSSAPLSPAYAIKGQTNNVTSPCLRTSGTYSANLGSIDVALQTTVPYPSKTRSVCSPILEISRVSCRSPCVCPKNSDPSCNLNINPSALPSKDISPHPLFENHSVQTNISLQSIENLRKSQMKSQSVQTNLCKVPRSRTSPCPACIPCVRSLLGNHGCTHTRKPYSLKLKDKHCSCCKCVFCNEHTAHRFHQSHNC